MSDVDKMEEVNAREPEDKDKFDDDVNCRDEIEGEQENTSESTDVVSEEKTETVSYDLETQEKEEVLADYINQAALTYTEENIKRIVAALERSGTVKVKLNFELIDGAYALKAKAVIQYETKHVVKQTLEGLEVDKPDPRQPTFDFEPVEIPDDVYLEAKNLCEEEDFVSVDLLVDAINNMNEALAKAIIKRMEEDDFISPVSVDGVYSLLKDFPEKTDDQPVLDEDLF